MITNTPLGYCISRTRTLADIYGVRLQFISLKLQYLPCRRLYVIQQIKGPQFGDVNFDSVSV